MDEPSSRPGKKSASKEPDPLLKAAREVWALACWVTLRETWKIWEETRDSSASGRSKEVKLPPFVERFFGLYCHQRYVGWIPYVVAETVNRPKRQREQRLQKKARAEKEALQSAGLDIGIDGSLGGENSGQLVIQREKLGPSEEVESILVEEMEWAVGEDDDLELGDNESDWGDRGGENVPRLDYQKLSIEVPSRPYDSDDRTSWVAWERTLLELLRPTPGKKRVLMNELFRQASNPAKKTETSGEVLRCLTGYLKAIVREAVRREAREQRQVISNEERASTDAPLPGAETGHSSTGADVLPDPTDTSDTVASRELEAMGVALAAKEYAQLHDQPGVKLGYFSISLKAEGDGEGFTLGMQNPAILKKLGYQPKSHHLYEAISKSKQRLKRSAADCVPEESKHVRSSILAYAGQELLRLCATWFWSEEIDRGLFGCVVALINANKGVSFACPHIPSCSQAPDAPLHTRCWQCPRK